MKFLGKSEDSSILTDGSVYKEKGDNSALRQRLLTEQQNFCAYTEKWVAELDSVDIEHFDDARKGTDEDDYWNWYATLHSANQRKRIKRKKHEGASFFTSRFYQRYEELERRIRYVLEDHVYEETGSDDHEAEALIDYLGFNDPSLVRSRSRHVERLRKIFDELGWGRDERMRYLTDNPDQLSFITALEKTLDLRLVECLKK